MQHNYVGNHHHLKHVNKIFSHVDIRMLNVDIDKSNFNIIILHVDMIWLDILDATISLMLT